MPAVTRVADTVAAVLAAHGVRHAFGMPGGEVVTLVDGLEKAGIRFHLARHETAAAIMAAGCHAAGGGPGLLVTTVGPGLANAVNGIADASQERVPLVVISGVVDRATRARYTHQVIDHAALLRPLVKASFEIEAESAGPAVARALALALAEPPGPVHLDLSPATAADADPQPLAFGPVRRLVPAPSPADPSVAEITDRLAAARRPVVVAGAAVLRAGAVAAFRRFADRLSAPVVTTYKAKGVIPEDHPLALGAAGLSPAADRILKPLIDQSDLVVAVGYDPIEMRLGWLDFSGAPDRLVEIGPASDHAMHAAALRLDADLAAALDAVTAALPAGATDGLDRTAAARAALDARFTGPDGFGPHAIVRALARAAGDEAIVTVDSGAHRILLSQVWQARAPGRLLQSAGFCTMAAALPLAIGAAVADPGRRVFAVMGDGGLEMGIGELATLRDFGLSVTVVVFQDRSLALIALKQASAGLAPAGVGLGETDFARVAEGFGGRGVTVDDEAALDAALAAAAGSGRFTLIACRFDADAYTKAF